MIGYDHTHPHCGSMQQTFPAGQRVMLIAAPHRSNSTLYDFVQYTFVQKECAFPASGRSDRR